MANTDLQRCTDLRDADLTVSGGHLVTPGGVTQGDVVCLGGRGVALDAHGWSSEEAIDARGLHVLPGVIDSQVHFGEPGMEHKETIEAGSRGAVLGGVTAVFEMPNTKPLTISAADFEEKQRRAAATSWCDYAFYIGGSAVNASQLAELEQLPGCAGVKVFMGSSFGDLLCDDREVLRAILKHGYRRALLHGSSADVGDRLGPNSSPLLLLDRLTRLDVNRLFTARSGEQFSVKLAGGGIGSAVRDLAGERLHQQAVPQRKVIGIGSGLRYTLYEPGSDRIAFRTVGRQAGSRGRGFA